MPRLISAATLENASKRYTAYASELGRQARTRFKLQCRICYVVVWKVLADSGGGTAKAKTLAQRNCLWASFFEEAAAPIIVAGTRCYAKVMCYGREKVQNF